MPPRAFFSEQWQREEREERDRLRQLEARLNSLLDKRRELVGQVRGLSAKQQELYNRRQAPQAEAEQLHEEFGQLGRHLSELRRGCEAARRKLEDAVIRRRELVLTFDRGERLNPEQVRREMAELELRQQTRALPIKEEDALIAELRQKAKELKEFEARKEIAAEHERQRHEADAAIVAARAEVARLVEEMETARSERDKRRGEIPARLEAAGALVAEMRVAGRARAELLTQLDVLGREIAEVEREGRELMARSRQRRADAREILKEYARPLPSPRRNDPSAVAESHLEELMKRGKVTLRG
ncbi:MAG: hypothetical protein ACLQD8_00530 [Thermoplasmata archaeon]